MRSIVGYLIGALLIALLGIAALRVSRFENSMADAQQYLEVQDYERSVGALDEAERQERVVQWVPVLGGNVANDVRARKAALLYWQRKYDELAATRTDTVSADDAENVALQLVMANAGFRLAQTKAKDRESARLAFEEAMNGYLSVLRNSPWNEDVSYNYEYAVRLFQAASQRTYQVPVPEEQAPEGEEGAPETDSSKEDFKIYVPLEKQEREPGGAGEGSPIQRRG